MKETPPATAVKRLLEMARILGSSPLANAVGKPLTRINTGTP